MRGLLCRLEPWDPQHTDLVTGWLTDSQCEALLRGTSVRILRAREYGWLSSQESGRAALVRDHGGQVVGFAHFWRTGQHVYEIGGATGDEALWGTGIGIEAGMLLVDYLFEVMAAQRVEFTTGLHNAQTMGIGMRDDDLRVEAVCGDYFQTATGGESAVRTALTRTEYEQIVLDYQPRVGRRVDHHRAEELVRSLLRRHGLPDVPPAEVA